jgi:hypothetical protein
VSPSYVLYDDKLATGKRAVVEPEVLELFDRNYKENSVSTEFLKRLENVGQQDSMLTQFIPEF